MEVEWQDGVWMPLESVTPNLVWDRAKILDKVRFYGAEVADDARIAVYLGEDEVCYAVENVNGDWVFLQGTLFTPNDDGELCKVVEQVFKEKEPENANG